MPAEPLDARIRISDYTAADDGANSADDGKDLIFRLQVTQIKRELTDQVQAIVLPQFKGTLTVPFPTVLYTISLQGRFFDTSHVAHPVAGGSTHVPDFIDLEEMAVTFNAGAPGPRKANLVWLELDLTKDAASTTVWRTYRGVILQTVLVREAGRLSGDFTISFGVVWEPTASFPNIREWA